MLVLAVCSLKGGVGKTSVTLGLASAAMARDIPTLVVDLDPQGDATAGLDVLKTKTTLADVLVKPRRAVVEDAVVPSGWTPESTGRVDLLGGGRKLVTLDGTGVDTREVEALRVALGKLPHKYKLVLVDCPPNLGTLTTLGLSVSGRALVVAEPGIFSISAADRALRLIDDIRRRHASSLQPLGVLINRVRARSTEHDYRVAELTKLFGPLVIPTQLRERGVVQSTQGAGVPIHQWKDPAAKELAAQFDQLMDRALRAPKRKKKG